MKLDMESAYILGLDQTEVRILSSIEDSRLTFSQISATTKIPRTSLYYTLPRLLDRKLVNKTKFNGKICWQKSTNEEIKLNFQNALNNISDQNTDSFTNTLSEDTSITFYHGAENVAKIFEEIVKSPAHSRWYGIQPGPSIMDLIPKVPIQNVVKFNKSVKRKHYIVEGIVHEYYIDKMKDIMEPENFKALLESFGGRTADYAKLPPDYMSEISSEIYLFDERFAIVNWKEEFAVIIKNADVFNLLREMFKSTKYLLHRYDQNEKVARKLVDLG